MSEHTATIVWERGEQPFVDKKYSRAHRWRFDGGAEVAASSAPTSVKPPLSDPAAVDPEEALVAALSACHMLFFLALAAKAGFVVDHYEDAAGGVLERLPSGKTAMTKVTLRPAVRFVGDKQPSADDLARLHHESHDLCYIANTVTSEIRVEPR